MPVQPAVRSGGRPAATVVEVRICFLCRAAHGVRFCPTGPVTECCYLVQVVMVFLDTVMGRTKQYRRVDMQGVPERGGVGGIRRGAIL
ncbi:MAG: hypothetical protein FD153_838 [Rhodospirillaceae bacterium]|nr:MAG: hypothetical protein FD153_838 [Rhodospirillaceae bacterium]